MAFSLSICVPLMKLPGSPAPICLVGNYSVALEVPVGGGAAGGIDRRSELLSVPAIECCNSSAEFSSSHPSSASNS